MDLCSFHFHIAKVQGDHSNRAMHMLYLEGYSYFFTFHSLSIMLIIYCQENSLLHFVIDVSKTVAPTEEKWDLFSKLEDIIRACCQCVILKLYKNGLDCLTSFASVDNYSAILMNGCSRIATLISWNCSHLETWQRWDTCAVQSRVTKSTTNLILVEVLDTHLIVRRYLSETDLANNCFAMSQRVHLKYFT